MYADSDINPLIALEIGKIIIAAAWADGEIQEQEMVIIREMLNQLPDLSAEDLAVLEDLMETPIEETEKEVFIEELNDMLVTPQERTFAIYWLEQMVNATGEVIEAEREFLADVKKRLTPKRPKPMVLQQAAKVASNGTSQLDHRPGASNLVEVLTHKIAAIREAEVAAVLSDKDLRKMCLQGILLARVTRADNRISESEVKVLINFIGDAFGLAPEEARVAARILLTRDLSETDNIHLCLEVKDSVPESERGALLDVLFEISLGDGRLSDVEMHEITNMAACMGVDGKVFQDQLKQRAEQLPS